MPNTPDLTIFPFDLEVADIARRLRRQYRMRLPDAAIWAMARAKATLLITRNTKDYPNGEPDIRFRYRL